MSKERELLQRTQQLVEECAFILGDAKPEFHKLCADLAEYLSEPEVEQKPFCYITSWEHKRFLYCGTIDTLINPDPFKDESIPLYTAPPKRQPLNEKEVAELLSIPLTFVKEGSIDRLVALIRKVEKAHGISDEK